MLHSFLSPSDLKNEKLLGAPNNMPRLSRNTSEQGSSITAHVTRVTKLELRPTAPLRAAFSEMMEVNEEDSISVLQLFRSVRGWWGRQTFYGLLRKLFSLHVQSVKRQHLYLQRLYELSQTYSLLPSPATCNFLVGTAQTANG